MSGNDEVGLRKLQQFGRQSAGQSGVLGGAGGGAGTGGADREVAGAGGDVGKAEPGKAHQQRHLARRYRLRMMHQVAEQVLQCRKQMAGSFVPPFVPPQDEISVPGELQEAHTGTRILGPRY